MVGISATDGLCQVPVMWIISSLAHFHFHTSYASAQDVVWRISLNVRVALAVIRSLQVDLVH